MTQQMQQITMQFPQSAPGAAAWLDAFQGILAQVHQQDGCYAAAEPAGALPMLALALADVPAPTVLFDGVPQVAMDLGGLIIGQVERAGTAAGEPGQGMPMAEFCRHLAGWVRRIDHAGINLPTSMVGRPQWDALVQAIASACNLYRYPEEFEWPFILPSTAAEFATDIEQFTAQRAPRFEFVYDEWSKRPVIQFALIANMTQAEVAATFPAPVGFGIPGLDHIFWSVVVAHPWSGLSIRMDIYYAGDDTDDFQTGEWLVRHGGRIGK